MPYSTEFKGRCFDGTSWCTLTLDEKYINEFDTSTRAQTIGWLEQIGEIHWPLRVHRLVSFGRFPHLSTWQKFSEADEQAIQDDGELKSEEDAATVLSNNNIREVYDADVIAGCDSIPWIVPHKLVENTN